MPSADQSKQASAAVRMTTAEAVVETLIVHGITTVYALPGVHNTKWVRRITFRA